MGSNQSSDGESDLSPSRSSSVRIVPGIPDADVESWVGIASAATPAEASEEQTIVGLRPDTFDEYIGQERIKENLKIACSAAVRRGEALDHVLLHGPPGLGKTSLARILANELGASFKATSGPVIEKPGDLAALLSTLQARDVLFIDEIHRLPRVVEEVLYPAMEDFQIDILIGHGPAARSVKLDLKPFTLIGATTRSGMLTSPLRDRFGMVTRLDFYGAEDLTKIVERSAQILGIILDRDSAAEIGRRSRGTPRIANRLLKRVRDFSQERAGGKINRQIASDALQLLEIDNQGLDMMDRKIMTLMIEKFSGGPVGIETISAAIGDDKTTIEDVYEPYLVQEGYIARTRRGREVTDKGYEALGKHKIASQTALKLKGV